MEITRTYTIARIPTNRYWNLAREIDQELKIPRGQLMGLFKRKGIDKVDEIFRKVMKDEPNNKAALFLHLVSKLPTIKYPKKPKQLKLQWKTSQKK